MAPRSFFFQVGDVLTVLGRRYGLHTRLFEARLSERWPEIAGELVALHTRPDGIRFKRLYLLVENSVWLQQLMFFKPALLEKINVAAGKPLITDIVLRIGTLVPVADTVPEGGAKVEVEPAAISDVQTATTALALAFAEPIADPVLRARLATLMSRAWTRPIQRPRERSR